jgi:hypothetical protein
VEEALARGPLDHRALAAIGRRQAAVSGCGRIGSLGHFASAAMSKQYKNINPELATWIAEQRMFFVATAPLSSDGHLNLSPKGGDAFRVLGPLEVVYQDYTGSGVETVAHIRENGRIVIMFCAFAGSPKILRLHGRGTILAPGDPRFTAMESLFPANSGTRAFIHIAVTRVVDSCGWAVPVYDFRCHRDTLDQWAATPRIRPALMVFPHSTATPNHAPQPTLRSRVVQLSWISLTRLRTAAEL